MKICTKCKKELSIECFHKNSSRKDGLNKWCKSCRSLYQKTSKNYKLYQINYRVDNKDQKRKTDKLYYENNKESIKKKVTNYHLNRLKTDKTYWILNILRKRILNSIKKGYKSDSTLNLLGCSLDKFKNHLQNTATNNGYFDFDINLYSSKDYHIDHIIPCDSFNLDCSYHQKLCFNYTNMQILTAKENIRKHNRIEL